MTLIGLIISLTFLFTARCLSETIWTKEQLSFLDRMRSDYKQEIDELKTEIFSMRNKVKEMKEREMQQGVDTNIQKQREVPRLLERSVQTSVAFYVQLSHNHTIVYARAVPYDIVSVNQGNGYDKVSHVFRAPKAGLYFFTNTVMSTPGHSIKVEIEKNGVTIGKNQADTNGYESGTVSVIVQLSVHDNVWVRYPGYTKAQLAQDYNSFSGFLISAN